MKSGRETMGRRKPQFASLDPGSQFSSFPTGYEEFGIVELEKEKKNNLALSSNTHTHTQRGC